MHATCAVAVPGFVRADTFHVHETSPSDPAVGVVFRPAAVDTLPEGQVTLAEQIAPGVVFAAMLAVDLGTAGSGRLTNRTKSVPAGLAVVGFAVGAAVVRGTAVPAVSGRP